MHQRLTWSVDGGEETSDRAQDSRAQRPGGAGREGKERGLNENGESHPTGRHVCCTSLRQ